MPIAHLPPTFSGGGIAGLSLAVTLGKYSQIVVDIYESAQEMGTVGAGLVVWKRTWEVMRQIGLDVEMTKRGISHPSDGQSLFVFITVRSVTELLWIYLRSGDDFAQK